MDVLNKYNVNPFEGSNTRADFGYFDKTEFEL